MRKIALLELLEKWQEVRYTIDSKMEYACKALGHPKRKFESVCYCGKKKYGGKQ